LFVNTHCLPTIEVCVVFVSLTWSGTRKAKQTHVCDARVSVDKTHVSLVNVSKDTHVLSTDNMGLLFLLVPLTLAPSAPQ
jgi:hypothetical protein